MSAYKQELINAMTLCAEVPNTIFTGQAVQFPGTAMHGTLKHIPLEKRFEMPVAEDMQLGMAIGQALYGMLPITIFPRIQFLLAAVNQLVHLIKFRQYGMGWDPKVIIRTAVPDKGQLDPGPQHLGNYTRTLTSLILDSGVVFDGHWAHESIEIISLSQASDIVPAYKHALKAPRSFIMLEYLARYSDPA